MNIACIGADTVGAPLVGVAAPERRLGRPTLRWGRTARMDGHSASVVSA